MRRHLFCTALGFAVLGATAPGQMQGEPTKYELVSLREDVRLLAQRVG